MTGPLGPRVRTQYVFVMDYVDECIGGVKTLRLACLNLSSIEDLMKLSYIDSDSVDVLKVAGRTYKALVAGYYQVNT